MKKGLTELVFILDRSGSMSGLEADTIGGFNSLIEKQKKETGAAGSVSAAGSGAEGAAGAAEAPAPAAEGDKKPRLDVGSGTL